MYTQSIKKLSLNIFITAHSCCSVLSHWMLFFIHLRLFVPPLCTEITSFWPKSNGCTPTSHKSKSGVSKPNISSHNLKHTNTVQFISIVLVWCLKTDDRKDDSQEKGHKENREVLSPWLSLMGPICYVWSVSEWPHVCILLTQY